ncbi:MAG: hypothetical protein OXC08_00810 [Thiotrichales bacterium]|nr:hypothetical protein [Thiotrichales bacterium]
MVDGTGNGEERPGEQSGRDAAVRDRDMSEDGQPLDRDAMTNTVLDLAVEAWRFGRAIDRLLVKLGEGEQRRHQRQLRWFQKKVQESLDAVEMRIVSLQGEAFDTGMAATPLNIDEFSSDDMLVVDQMLEPIVMGPDGVVRTGTVTLKKVDT